MLLSVLNGFQTESVWNMAAPRIQLRLDPDIHADLELLADAKSYGTSPTEVAERFVTDRVAELIRSGEIAKLVDHRKAMKGVTK